jgi:uncharacterized protein
LIALLCFNSCKDHKSKNDFTDKKPTHNSQPFKDSIPKPIGWVNDFEGLFTDKEKQQLDSIISAFEKETTVEISILTLNSTAVSSERFNDFALHIGNAWAIGKKDKKNGVFICISQALRHIRICNGYGIEKILSDSETKEIMDKYFIAAFKEGEYFKGTKDGLLALINTLRTKKLP